MSGTSFFQTKCLQFFQPFLIGLVFQVPAICVAFLLWTFQYVYISGERPELYESYYENSRVLQRGEREQEQEKNSYQIPRSFLKITFWLSAGYSNTHFK